MARDIVGLKINADLLDGLSASDFAQVSGGNLTLSSGNLVIGTSGKGIDFSATSDAAGSTSELLDDYEEGTWTPAYTPQTSGSVTHNLQDGVYQKIGDTVYVSGRLRTSSISSPSGDVYITGLPFTCGESAGGALTIGLIQNFATSMSPLRGQILKGNDYFRIFDNATDVANAELQGSDFGTANGDNLMYFSCVYKV